MKIMILGAKGFLGSHLTALKEIESIEKILPSRSFKEIKKTGRTLLLPFEKTWEIAIQEKPDAIVNLVGVLKESYKGEYETAHLKTAQEIAKYCLLNPSVRIVQISALGPQSCEYAQYFKTKREAERIISQASQNAVILRPGIIFGEGQKVFSQIKDLSLLSPVIFCPKAKTAIISVEKTTQLISKAIFGEIKPGIYEAYEEISDLKTFFQRSLTFMGLRRKTIALPKIFFLPIAMAGEFLPFLPLNLAQYKMLSCQALPTGAYPKL